MPSKKDTQEQETEIGAATASFDQLNQHLAEVEHKFGDGLPYERERIIHEATFYLERSAEAMLEAGKLIIRLKEHEQRGDFLDALETIGLAPRVAQKMMQAALKYSDPSMEPLIGLGKCKLLELMTEDDEDLQELADGGSMLGHTLDDIDRMSVRELKGALREARMLRDDEQEANDHLIQNKNKKIDELHKKLTASKKKAQPWDKRIEEYIIETNTAALAALQAVEQLEALREIFMTDDFGEDNEAAMETMAVSYYDTMSQVVGRISEVSMDADEVFRGYRDAANARLANNTVI